MKVRAIKDLCQLNDSEFFSEISRGMELIIGHAEAIEQGAQRLHGENGGGYSILRAVASEEAAKALILFDAVRCPRNADGFGRHLQGFNNHLAKGIYRIMCDWEPASMREVCENIDRERDDYYVDGPNDDDWKFPNEIVHSRERNMYVDYVKSGDAHMWLEPCKLESGFPYNEPRVLVIGRELRNLGCFGAEALAVIASIWRPVKIDEDYSRIQLRQQNHDTLSALKAKHCLSAEGGDEARLDTIRNLLHFPLHGIDLLPRRSSPCSSA